MRLFNKYDFFKKHSILLLLLFFCLGILIASITMIVNIYSKAYDITYNKIIKLHETVLNTLSMELDNNITGTESIYLQMSRRDSITSLISASERGQQIDMADKNNAQQAISSVKPLSGLIDDIYIYFKNTDLVISDTSPMDKKTAYNVFHSDDDIDMAEWEEIMSASHFDEILSIPSLKGGKISFMGTLPVNSQNGATFVALLNADNMRETLNRIIPDNVNVSVLIYFDDNLIFTNGQTASFDLNNIPEDKTDNMLIYENEHQKYVVTENRSKLVTNLRYISFTPKKDLTAEIKTMRRQLFVIIAVLFAIWCVFVYYTIKEIYRPIYRLASKLRNGQPESANQNEIATLESNINISQKKIYDLTNNIETQHSRLETNFISDWLTGKITDEQKIRQNIDSLKLSLNNDIFIVVLFEIHDYKKMREKFNYSETDNIASVAHMIISNVVRDLFADYGSHYETVINPNRLAMLWNISSKAEYTERTNSILSKFLEYAHTFILENFDLDFTSCISAPHDFASVNHAYYEASSLLYSLKSNPSVVIFNKNKYTFQQLMEQESIALENYIKKGNAEQACRLIDNIFAGSMPNKEFLMAMQFHILSIILNTLDPDQYKSFLSDFQPVTRLSASISVSDSSSSLKDILRAVCNLHESEESGQELPDNTLSKKLMDYISENYNNPQLNVQTIGFNLNYTAHYLSQQFKKQTGTTLKTYLSQYRLERAKDLLTNTELTISAIANDTGFTDVNAMIRIFKKYTSLTPAEYRKISKPQQ